MPYFSLFPQIFRYYSWLEFLYATVSLSPMLQHKLYQAGRILGRLFFKFFKADRRTFVRLIRNSSQDDERNLVYIAYLGYGCAFHIDTIPVKLWDNPGLCFLRGNKLVSRANPPFQSPDLGQDCSYRLYSLLLVLNIFFPPASWARRGCDSAAPLFTIYPLTAASEWGRWNMY